MNVPQLGITNNYVVKTPNVKVENNILYFFDCVDDQTSQLFVSGIDKLTSGSNRNDEFVDVNIHSYGGWLTGGTAMLDSVISNQIPVHITVFGCAASAATLPTVGAAKRSIGSHSTMLIHQLSTVFWGKYAELEDEKKNCDLFMDIIKTVYRKYTKVPSDKLDSILRKDLWFNAKDCLKYGLVDEILGK